MKLFCLSTVIYYTLPLIVFGQQLLFLPFGRLGYVLRRLKQKDSMRRQPVNKGDIIDVMEGKAYPTTVFSHSYKSREPTVTQNPNMSKGLVPVTYKNTSLSIIMKKIDSKAQTQPKTNFRITPTPAPLTAPPKPPPIKIPEYTPEIRKNEQTYQKFTSVPNYPIKSSISTPSKLPSNTICVNCTKSLKSYETFDDTSLYAYAHSSKLEPLLIGLYDATRTKELPPPLTWKTTVTPECVQLTQNIIRLVKPNRVLVIGVYTGLGVLASALAINPRGLVVGIEYPQYLKYWEVAGDKFAQTAGLMRRIQIKADKPIPLSLESLVSKEPGTFDFIILDDHALENYMMDYERALTLLRNGGAMIINDVLADGSLIANRGTGRSPGGQLMDQLNKKVRDDGRVFTTLLPFSGGVTLIVKK